ncbi:hypothetical protein BDV96DRAFT_584642 [Lophiotrema nucula]|uniref:Uncharacterized protein n=1 Tax=Lophiotrema nucula TaxID=690887 RepID=A0A6A5YRK5_9PLEO|nr:hypothetical protein BDV96DRAFT_584642 [Lophiotrema nucula]
MLFRQEKRTPSSEILSTGATHDGRDEGYSSSGPKGTYQPIGLRHSKEWSASAILAPKRFAKSYIVPWWWEVLGASFSIAFLSSIFAILLVVDNKSINSWHFRIEPNALVSVFATGAKATLILIVAECIGQLKWIYFMESKRRVRRMKTFDEASRGPAGAFVFLLSLKGKPVLATVGAGVTILALLLEPFSQQVLSFSSRQTNIRVGGLESLLPTTHIFDQFFYARQNASASNTTFSISLQGAIVGSMFNLERTPSYTCGGPECIWRDVTTLGICATCEDATATTNRSCRSMRENIWTYIAPEQAAVKEDNLTVDSCDFTPPGLDEPLAARYIDMTQYTPFYTPPFLVNVNSTFQRALSAWPQPFFGTFAAIQLPSNFTLPMPSPLVTKCTLTWCAKTFESISVINGSYSTTGVDSVPFSNDSQELPEEPGSPSSDYHGFVVDSKAYPNFKGNRTFVIDQYSYYDFPTQLEDLIQYDKQPEWLSRIFSEHTNYSMMMHNLSDALSETIRTLSPNRTFLEGDTYGFEAYIEVRWPWMILPSLLVIAGNVLLVSTMVVSKRHAAPLWRNSALPLLLHGFSGLDPDKVDRKTMVTQRELEMEAQNIRVTLKT